MNLIEQHMENVGRELDQLEQRMVQLKEEQAETRKLLGNIRRYRKSLNKQYPSSQATLPLAPPDDDEEEATDEAPEPESAALEEPLIPDEWNPDYEVPTEADATADTMAQDWEPAPAEPEKPIRRRKAKAAAEEVSNG